MKYIIPIVLASLLLLSGCSSDTNSYDISKVSTIANNIAILNKISDEGLELAVDNCVGERIVSDTFIVDAVYVLAQDNNRFVCFCDSYMIFENMKSAYPLRISFDFSESDNKISNVEVHVYYGMYAGTYS